MRVSRPRLVPGAGRGGPPSRLALVTVLQRAENLTDRLAADAVGTRIDWKYMLGLSLDDPSSPKPYITPGHTVIEADAPLSMWCCVLRVRVRMSNASICVPS